MKKLLTKLNNWRRNRLFVTAAEARAACSNTFLAGQNDARYRFAEAVLSLTSYKAERKSAHLYDIRLTVNAATMGTEAGDIAAAVMIAEDVATRIVTAHRNRKH